VYIKKHSLKTVARNLIVGFMLQSRKHKTLLTVVLNSFPYQQKFSFFTARIEKPSKQFFFPMSCFQRQAFTLRRKSPPNSCITDASEAWTMTQARN